MAYARMREEAALEFNDVESRDAVEMPDVRSSHTVTEFERADPDQKV